MNPQGCVDSNCTFIYKWSDNKDKTDFEITTLLDSSVSRYLFESKILINFICIYFFLSDLAWMAVGEYIIVLSGN